MTDKRESYDKAKAYVDRQLALGQNGEIPNEKYLEVIRRVVRATPRSKDTASSR